MSRAILTLGGLLGVIVLANSVPLSAAELPLPQAGAAEARSPASIYCGICGCLQVAYVHHREVEATYGLAFDPRNDDQTQPYFYLGRMRAYPRFFVDGVPVPGSCD
jgi:hypothetical protein